MALPALWALVSGVQIGEYSSMFPPYLSANWYTLPPSLAFLPWASISGALPLAPLALYPTAFWAGARSEHRLQALAAVCVPLVLGARPRPAVQREMPLVEDPALRAIGSRRDRQGDGIGGGHRRHHGPLEEAPQVVLARPVPFVLDALEVCGVEVLDRGVSGHAVRPTHLGDPRGVDLLELDVHESLGHLVEDRLRGPAVRAPWRVEHDDGGRASLGHRVHLAQRTQLHHAL